MTGTTRETWFYRANYVVLTLIGLSCVLPLVHIAALSFSDKFALAAGTVSFWPENFDTTAYRGLFLEMPMLESFRNSVVITLVGTALNMLFTILAAYPLSKHYFIGRKFYSFAVIFTMLFSAGMIPNYLLVKSLGLIDTYGSLWLPGLVSVWNLMVLRSFFESMPEEMEEAARIDGCSEWRLLARIVLPLSLPVLAALALFYGVAQWNNFMNVLLYINSSEKWNLAVLVQQLFQNQEFFDEMANTRPDLAVVLTPEGVKSAGVIVMTLPMLVVYPFLQRYFVKGVMIGAVKG